MTFWRRIASLGSLVLFLFIFMVYITDATVFTDVSDIEIHRDVFPSDWFCCRWWVYVKVHFSPDIEICDIFWSSCVLCCVAAHTLLYTEICMCVACFMNTDDPIDKRVHICFVCTQLQRCPARVTFYMFTFIDSGILRSKSSLQTWFLKKCRLVNINHGCFKNHRVKLVKNYIEIVLLLESAKYLQISKHKFKLILSFCMKMCWNNHAHAGGLYLYVTLPRIELT